MKIKFSKKNLNIWVLSEEGDIKLIKVPIKKRLEFIKMFIGKNEIPKEMDVIKWLVKDKEGYYI
jgi:hypothetical protein